MNKIVSDPFGARASLDTLSGPVAIYRLERLAELGLVELECLPYSIRVWLEGLLRQCNGWQITEEQVEKLARWDATSPGLTELPFKPARVILQDFTGVPAVVDLAALRSAMHRLGGDPTRINPQAPVDLVIDHSVQVDRFGTDQALAFNSEREFARNRERYEFLHWAQNAFDDFRVVPPATGIVHQVNLEYLASVVVKRQEADGSWVAFPDTLVGTDSHTTMINGLGVMGWGVGGIEAEAAMLGEPITMLPPEVVGFELVGELPDGATATDLVLTATQALRRKGVVGKFVEYYGPGVARLSLPDRATLANMSPEYGATMGFFPVDDETLRYLRSTGRPAGLVDLVERYTKSQKLFRPDDAPVPVYSDTLMLDLSTVGPSLAGPKRPQDRIRLSDMRPVFREALRAPTEERGFALAEEAVGRAASLGSTLTLGHGAVVIAAITSCTNTSNPSVMIGAGLVAKKAVERGLRVPAYVKTSLAPGSTVVTRYLDAAGLTPFLDQLGFNLVGYGCTTCIGNSGPVLEEVSRAVEENELVVSAVLSGNRNFEGRISPHVQANYLASPPLVVAYALAGTVDADLLVEPLGYGSDDQPVFLQDIWPSQAEIQEAVAAALDAQLFKEQYADAFSSNATWNAISVPDPSDSVDSSESGLFGWAEDSTYIKEAPFWMDLTPGVPPTRDIKDARVLVMLGDSVTTDHISPAGSIASDSPAGRYLLERGVTRSDFNSYGSRRGNHQVMMRGTFANIRLKNLLLPGTEGGITVHLPSGDEMSIYDAALRYQEERTPVVVLGGTQYGTGSSRDWAAKGAYLLGVKAVIVESYERIHRSNLVGMGVLPLQFEQGENAVSLGLTGREVFDITGVQGELEPGQRALVCARREDGTEIVFSAVVRLDTPVEVAYYCNGGVLHTILRRMIQVQDK